jgi:hypothetical protein
MLRTRPHSCKTMHARAMKTALIESDEIMLALHFNRFYTLAISMLTYRLLDT